MIERTIIVVSVPCNCDSRDSNSTCGDSELPRKDRLLRSFGLVALLFVAFSHALLLNSFFHGSSLVMWDSLPIGDEKHTDAIETTELETETMHLEGDEILDPNYHHHHEVKFESKFDDRKEKAKIATTATAKGSGSDDRLLPVYTVTRDDCKVKPVFRGGSGGSPPKPVSASVSAAARVLGHARTMHRILDDAENENDIVLIVEDPDLREHGDGHRGREQDENNHLEEGLPAEFLRHGWKALVDTAPLDWSILALSLSPPYYNQHQQHKFDITNSNNTATFEELFAMRASKIYRGGRGDLWTSWSPFDEEGLRSYLVSRKEVKRILNQSGYEDGNNYGDGFGKETAKLLIQQEPRQGIQRNTKDENPTVSVSQGHSFSSLLGGSVVYSSTLPPFVLSPPPHRNGILDVSGPIGNLRNRKIPSLVTTGENQKHKKPRTNPIPSLLVITTIQIRDLESIRREASWLTTDANELARVHTKYHSGLPLWKVKVVVASEDLLAPAQKWFRAIADSIVVGNVPRIDANIRCEFAVDTAIAIKDEIETNRHIKLEWTRENLGYVSDFDKVLLKDSNQRIAGISWRTFLEHSEKAVLSGPLTQIRWQEDPSMSRPIPMPTSVQSTFRARSWMGEANANDNAGSHYAPSSVWAMDKFYNVRSLEIPLLEPYFVLMDGKFAEWYLPTALTALAEPTLDTNTDTIDGMWCEGARSYLKELEQRKDKRYQEKKGKGKPSVSCLLVLVTSVQEREHGNKNKTEIEIETAQAVHQETVLSENKRIVNSDAKKTTYDFMDDLNRLEDYCVIPEELEGGEDAEPLPLRQDNDEEVLPPPIRCVM